MNTRLTDKIDIACSRYKRVHKSNKPKFNKLDEWLHKESFIFENEIYSNPSTYLKYKIRTTILLLFQFLLKMVISEFL